MDLDKLTKRSQSALTEAQNLALLSNHPVLKSEHLLMALVDENDDILEMYLKQKCSSNIASIGESVRHELNKMVSVSGSGSGHLEMSPELKKVLAVSFDLAKKENDSFVTIERLLQGMLSTENCGARKILESAGASLKTLEEFIKELRGGDNADSENSEDRMNALEKYTVDLTMLAEKGKLDPVIGRDEEIRRTIQVLSRRTKNNPVLIGEPGVGKTAVVEGLAARITNGDVPSSLKKSRIKSLDLGGLIAGTKFRGEFEERLKAVIKAASAESDEPNSIKIILFIDEVHTLMGAGSTSDGSMDASNLLKPALARGQIHCIGATTLDEYREHIEKDAALARRFQPVFVDEPTENDTISILRGLKEKYEVHHGVRITDRALVSATTLSRLISDRHLPDKAIDLIDEAASRVRMTNDSRPEALDELDRKIFQLKIEEGVLEKESDPQTQERLRKIKEDRSALESKFADLNSKWQVEKVGMQNMQKCAENLDLLRQEVELAKRAGNLARVGELTYSLIPALEKELKEFEKNVGVLTKRQVDDTDVAYVLSKWTGIPVENMVESEKLKLLKMEEELQKMVVGQAEAIRAVSNAVRRSRAGVQDPRRPSGSFLFLGPTGVGKTELSKALAQFLFCDASCLLRFDMSEFMEKHSVARLIGAPPGYIGYEKGGLLTEAVRRRQYRVILFDEIEKAHMDVINIALQILDEGRLTDNHGRTVDFRNTILIITSNLGADFIIRDPKNAYEPVMNAVRSFFRPEFLNRLDDIIMFRSLRMEEMVKIVDIQLEYLSGLLAQKNIAITVSDDAKALLAERGFDPMYGARPLKRVIQSLIQDEIAKMILSDTVRDGSTVYMFKSDDNNISFKLA